MRRPRLTRPVAVVVGGVLGLAAIVGSGPTLRAQPSKETGRSSPPARSQQKQGPHSPRAAAPRRAKQLFAGRVVDVWQALKRRGLAVGDEMKGQVVLETPAGELIPIAADWRGRAFFQDKRLRDRSVQLVGFRRPGLPYLFVLTIYVFDEKGRRREVDYWCDTCAIPQYDLAPCSCCQGTVQLRLRLAESRLRESDAARTEGPSDSRTP